MIPITTRGKPEVRKIFDVKRKFGEFQDGD
jgi:hypothetical protein